MMLRIISAVSGAAFGAGGAILLFVFKEQVPIEWRIVALAALVMAGLAAAFGKQFWDTAGGKWPWLGV